MATYRDEQKCLIPHNLFMKVTKSTPVVHALNDANWLF